MGAYDCDCIENILSAWRDRDCAEKEGRKPSKHVGFIHGALADPYEKQAREQGFTLVELPEKHGRLVDADAFAEHLRETVKSVEAFAPQMAMALEAAVRDLEDPKKTPTIVETESEEDENEKTD